MADMADWSVRRGGGSTPSICQDCQTGLPERQGCWDFEGGGDGSQSRFPGLSGLSALSVMATRAVRDARGHPQRLRAVRAARARAASAYLSSV